MTSEENLFRFGGIQRLYGKKSFETLNRSRVLIVGLGGVGSWVVESLVRSAVGSLTLVDFDDICMSNTNRQIQAMNGNLGKLKSQVLKERALQINPMAEVISMDQAFDLDSEAEIFSRDYDLVVDALDHGLTKYYLSRNCAKRKIPIVVVGSAGGRRDPSQIKTGDLASVFNDRLLSILRKDLRRQADFPRKGPMGIACVFSTERALYPTCDDDVTTEKPAEFKKPLDCATGLGTATHLTGSFGFMAAHLAINQLLSSSN